MKTLFKYIYIITLICVLCSCERDELNVSGNGSERTIEIVTRIPGFNNVDVKAPADANRPFETAIYTAYLFIFDENGNIVGNYYNLSNGSLYKSLTLKGLNTITACIVANVQESVISNVTKLEDFNSIVLELDYADYSVSGYLGVPKLGNNLCFPMFGSVTQDISTSTSIQIPLTRLFAKITVDLSMNLDTKEWSDYIQLYSFFKIASYEIFNLPTKVLLVNNNTNPWESAWADVPEAFVQDNDNNRGKLSVTGLNPETFTFYNKNALGTNIKSVSFDVYVPEYSVLPNTDHEKFGNEEFKPEVYADGCYPTYLQITGSFNPVSGMQKNICYDIYLGEDESTNFTLNRNIQYNNYLTITGVSNHNGEDAVEVDHRVSIIPSDFVYEYGEVANCYIINKVDTEYKLPAYKGAYKSGQMVKANMCTEGTHVEIVAQSNTNNVTFNNYGNADDPVYFTLEKNRKGEIIIGFKITAIANDSNVIIALKDDEGNIEWSWHLWFVKSATLGNTDFLEIDTQEMPGSKVNMMDRNIGSEYSVSKLNLPGTVDGLYYKYGCNDPHIYNTIDNQGYGYYGVENSENSTWSGTTKSHTDPCPPGYRVPASNVWDVNSATKQHIDMEYSGYGVLAFDYWNGGTLSAGIITDDIFYPYSGYESGSAITNTSRVDDDLIDLAANNFSISFRTEDKYSNESEPSGIGIQYQTRDVEYIEHEYTNFNYKTKIYLNYYGYLWGSDNTYLDYSYRNIYLNDTFEIQNCNYRSRVVKRQQQRFRTWVIYKWSSWSNWEELTSPSGTWSDYNQITKDVSNAVIANNGTTGSINNSSWIDQLKSNEKNRTFTFCEPVSFSNTPTEGYQIRCVKEKE